MRSTSHEGGLEPNRRETSLTRGPYDGRHARFVKSYLNGNPWRFALTTARNRVRYSHVAHPLKIVWSSPKAITHRLVVPRQLQELWRYGLVHDGDWDRTRIKSALDTDKVRSMRQRFEEGRPWEETDLFRDRYARMLADGIPIKGQTTMADLARAYERTYDVLYRDVAARGIVGPTIADPTPRYIEVHIGRAGELLGSSNGNHRLGMALALRLERIPFRVATRHHEWQRTRMGFARGEYASPNLLDHPDLADLAGARLRCLGQQGRPLGQP